MVHLLSLVMTVLAGWEFVGAFTLLIPVFVFILWAPIQLVRDLVRRRSPKRTDEVDENGIPYL